MWLCCTLAYGASVLARHVGLAVAGRLAGWQGMDDWLSPLSVHACVRMRAHALRVQCNKCSGCVAAWPMVHLCWPGMWDWPWQAGWLAGSMHGK